LKPVATTIQITPAPKRGTKLQTAPLMIKAFAVFQFQCVRRRRPLARLFPRLYNDGAAWVPEA
jgi:hypothetical protein